MMEFEEAMTVAFLYLVLIIVTGFLGWIPSAVFKLLLQWRKMKPLRQMLHNLESPERRAETFRRLQGDDELSEWLLKGLDPDNVGLSFDERVRAIELAGQIKLKKAAQPLIKLLKEFPMWEEIHAKAIWALGEIGDESVASELVPYLGEFNYLSIRKAAIETLHKLGWGEFVDAFNRLMFGNDEALEVLRERYRREAVRALVRALWANEPSVAITAANALGKLNAVEALKELKRRCSPFQSPKEIRNACREVVAKLEQFSRLPSPARSEIDTSTLPRPVNPSSFQTETLPSPAKPPAENEVFLSSPNECVQKNLSERLFHE